MKSIDPDRVDEVPGRRLLPGETFRFRCHPGVTCFNRCCRNLNLFLYPYDVMRLKNGLGLDSDAFLERHVDVVLRPGQLFPDVLLRMADNAERTCPFVSEAGCSVYADRPDTCRFFPLDQGLILREDGPPEKVYWYRPFDFCQGRFEETEWSVETWADDQDCRRYGRMTAEWAELRARFQGDPWGGEGPEGAKARMTFMAVYNLDRFRDFVFGSSFLKRYAIRPESRSKFKRDDAELLGLAFEWVRFFLFGVPPRRFKVR